MVDIIAHRGISKQAPENTLAAIQGAIDLNVNYVEIDVHLSKDGIPVIIHDPTTKRVTQKKELSKIRHLNLPEIKKIDVGSWFSQDFSSERIPTLEEVLSLKRNRTGLMIEIKKGRNPLKQLVMAVLDTILQSPSQESSLLLGSFSPEILFAIQIQKLNLPLIGIIEKSEKIAPFVEMGLKRLAVWHPLIDLTLIQQLHALGIQVWAFTVDKPKKIQELIQIGIDGIITNDAFNLVGKNYATNKIFP